MARFVRNLAGVIHSVADDFDIAARNAAASGKKLWEEVTEDIAKAEHAHLFGEPDPQVQAVLPHDGAGNPVAFDVLGNPDHVTSPPVEETPSTETQGKADARVIEPTPTPADVAVKADAKSTEATK